MSDKTYCLFCEKVVADHHQAIDCNSVVAGNTEDVETLGHSSEDLVPVGAPLESFTELARVASFAFLAALPSYTNSFPHQTNLAIQ